jgi:hypothetical protein
MIIFQMIISHNLTITFYTVPVLIILLVDRNKCDIMGCNILTFNHKGECVVYFTRKRDLES